MNPTNVIVLACLLVAAGCGDDSGGVSTCVPGATAACACPGGLSGVQECLADGTFGGCVCPGDGMDAGPTPGVDAGPTPGVDAGPIPAVDSGPTPTVDSGPMPRMDSGPTPTVDSGPTPTADSGPAPVDSGPTPVPDAGPPPGATGHVVLMGAHMWQPDESFDRIFANAIFLSERPGDLDVVEYTEYFPSGSGWEMHAHAVMDAEAAARGRRLVRTTLTSATGLGAALRSADVLFVPSQSVADEGTLMTIAAFWHDSLVAFVDAGGVIVVLSPALRGGMGRDFAWHLVDAPEFFGFSGATPPGFSTGMATTFEIADATDPLAVGVLSPWATLAGQMTCFPMSTRGRVVARSRDTLCPIVRHLAR